MHKSETSTHLEICTSSLVALRIARPQSPETQKARMCKPDSLPPEVEESLDCQRDTLEEIPTMARIAEEK